jgi:serine/threonine protein kinase
VLGGLYEVEQLIGAGGMGEVWKVRHRQWGISLAMKEPRAEVVGDTRHREAFQRETENWINLPMHPNVVTAHYVREMEGGLRLFCEYVEGENLGERLRRSWGRALSEEEALDIAIQVCEALAHAHRHQVAHRDIKPENVLIGRDGIVKVTDFGLAKAMGREEGAMASGVRGRGGTVRRATVEYMSPEQALKRQGADVEVSFPSDVWSLGVMLYEMVTGVVPVSGSVARQAIEEDLRRRESARQGVPSRAVMRVVWQCLREEPHKRAWLIERPPARKADWLHRDEPPNESLRAALTRAYRQVTGREYGREEAEAVEMSADDLNNRALSQLDLGHEERAKELWKEALRKEETHAASLNNLRVFAVKRREAAAELWAQWVQAGTDLGVRERARGLILAGEYEEGLRLLESESLSGNDSDGWNLMGAGMYGAGRVEGALEAYRRALEADGDHWQARWNLAIALFRQGDEAGAREQLLLLNGHCPRWARGMTPMEAMRFPQPDACRCLRVFEGHKDSVWSVAISPDGRYGLSGSRDKTLRLWELSSGKCLRVFEGHKNSVRLVAISPEGRYGLSGGGDGTLRLWDLRPPYWRMPEVALPDYVLCRPRFGVR